MMCSNVIAQEEGQEYEGRKSGEKYQAPSQGWFCPWCGRSQEMMRGQMPPPRVRPGSDYYGSRHMMSGERLHPYGFGRPTTEDYGYGMGQDRYQGRQRMPHRGYGMQQRMPHRGYGMHERQMPHDWSRGQSRPDREQIEPLDKEQARTLAENYIAQNPHLKVGQIEEQGEVYVAAIVTQDDSLVEKLVIDKQTGWFRRAY